ncbi:MAG: hypothetical protein JKX94_05130 [Sneathiella sp.]|nr:hypothetical protein [Sneathiella sp.]
MNKMINICAGVSLIAISLMMGSAAFAKETNQDTMPAIAAQCLSCHGADGKPELADVPIIAGQQPVYLANALRHYQSGKRTGGQALVMRELVKDLTNKDIEVLAKWFGEQK